MKRDTDFQRRNWQTRALCSTNRKSEDRGNLFFPPPEFESAHMRRKREIKAKTLCKSCDVKGECLSYALKNEELVGVWGGLNERERKQERARKGISEFQDIRLKKYFKTRSKNSI